jgi:redox-sensitive bicupin YhaK (pirin superfamily)
MAAGTGVLHSEFNPSETEPVHLLQIWIKPDTKGAKPNYAERDFKSAPVGSSISSRRRSGRDGSIAINQDAELLVGKFNGGETVTHPLRSGRHAWVHVAEGEATVERH